MTECSKRLMRAFHPILCAVLLLAGCGEVVKRDDAPVKHAEPAVSPSDYVQPSDVTEICTAGPKTRAGNPSSYVVFGKRYHIKQTACGYSETGLASWYGPGFHGKRTSSGQPYNMYAMTAAHKTLPLPVRVKVTNLENGKELMVLVNDRGPFHKGRIIDLSKSAAQALGVLAKGTARVRVTVVDRPKGGASSASPVHKPATESVMASGVETFPLSEADAPTVIDLPIQPNVTAPSPTQSNAGRIYIQMGSFVNQANAYALRDKLRLQGFNNAHVLPVTVNGLSLNRVRLVGIASLSEANQLSQRLQRLGYTTQKIFDP